MPRFTLLRDGRVQRSLTLLVDDLVIGRLPGSDIELASPSVSRRHARIHRDGSGWVLEDLGSVNGVLVRGERVRRHALSPGDVVAIEDHLVVFEPADELYAAGLDRRDDLQRSPQAFGMTFLSAAGFSAKDKPRGR